MSSSGALLGSVALAAAWAAGLPFCGTAGLLLLLAAGVRCVPWALPAAKAPVSPSACTKLHGEAPAGRAPSRDTGGATAQGTFVPSTGLLNFGDPDTVHVFENENARCSCFIMARPTDDPEQMAAGNYPHAMHFKGRQRLWELRFQLRVKRRPARPLVFGIELAEYVHVSRWARKLQQMTVATLRKVVGNNLYHSCGDDPKQVKGECEKPAFVMPFWAFDQFIVSELGQEPDLRDLSSLGTLRTEGRADFIRSLTELDMRPDKVYTFSFWCISRFIDFLNWEMKGVTPWSTDFNLFCGRPPVYIVMYELDADQDNDDGRHLDSRKRYFHRMALWSSKFPVPRKHLEALIPSAPAPVLEKAKKARWGSGLASEVDWTCCGPRWSYSGRS